METAFCSEAPSAPCQAQKLFPVRAGRRLRLACGAPQWLVPRLLALLQSSAYNEIAELEAYMHTLRKKDKKKKTATDF